jgi:hypothetical protein
MGEARLRADWTQNREKNTELLRQGLGNREFQDGELKHAAARLTATLGLTALDADSFTKRYREKRLKRVEEARQALAHNPPDYAGLAVALRGLYSDEDALAKKFGGDAGVEKVRTAEMEQRLGFLGTTVAWAGGPFSEVAW